MDPRLRGDDNIRAWLRGRRIGVLMGGTSAERAISLQTGRAIWQSLRRQGFKAVAIDAARPLLQTLQRKRITFAYIALHGPGGEDGAVQGLLEWLRIPYTGSGVLASALAMDKVASKRLFESVGLPTAPWRVISPSPFKGEGWDEGWSGKKPSLTSVLSLEGRGSIMRLPVVVKPASQGSAVGISIVKNAKQWPHALRKAFRYDRTVLVEKFLEGPEITVGILGSQALPVIEILPQHGRPFYDYHAKYAPGGSRHLLPARVSPAAARRAAGLSLAACRALGTRAVARVDLIVDKRRGPCLLEVNTIPGMTTTSLLPEAARAVGIDFDQLVLKIAEYSVEA